MDCKVTYRYIQGQAVFKGTCIQKPLLPLATLQTTVQYSENNWVPDSSYRTLFTETYEIWLNASKEIGLFIAEVTNILKYFSSGFVSSYWFSDP